MDLQHNYFQLFGLDEVFDLDAEALTERYRSLQKSLHPDRFANAPDQERRLSLQQAAHVNSGYETLRDPLARARYLLTLRVGEYCDETSTIADPEFLEEQMELREDLADIRSSQDAHSALSEFMSQLGIKKQDYIEKLRHAFSKDDFDAVYIKELVQRMQFLHKLQHEAENLEDELLF